MGYEHFRHPIASYRHRLGYDRRDCSTMGIIRILEIVKQPIEGRYWVDVHCLQYGRDYTVRFEEDEVGHIDFLPAGSLTLDSLQEEVDQFREHVNQAIDFFEPGDDYVQSLEVNYQDFFEDLTEIMEVNGIYSKFNHELILARHFLGQMA
jgi:hypothetical protein